jgi:ABC-2 type transport system permease protein
MLGGDRGARAGTVLMLRHHLRRDRVLASVWLLFLVVVCYASAAATPTLYATEADRVRAAEAINASPGVVALYGPIPDVHSLGQLAMTKMTVVYAVFVAIMFLVLVRRHTRTDEEAGRAELLAGTAVTREAPLAAALAEAALLAVLLGLLAALVNIAAGLPAVGSLAFGASWTAVALVATGVTLVACQVSASSRTCAALAGTTFGVLYLLRAVGDTSVGALSWLSPFGWSTQLHAYSHERWWVLALPAVASVGLVAVARALRRRRDLGGGMVDARPGPEKGAQRLDDATGLAWRVHGAALAFWSCALAVMGLVMGAIAPGIGSLLDSPAARAAMQRLGGAGTLQETMLAAMVSVGAVVVTCFALAVVAHGAADERDGRTEQVLATATSRGATLAATVVVAVGGVLWLLLVMGLALAVGFAGAGGGLSGTGLSGNGLSGSGRLVAAALVQAPAVWTVTALAVLLLALRSGWAVLGWALLGLFVALDQVGDLLRLPGWAGDLSPYAHTPRMPVEGFAAAPLLLLTLAAAAVLALACRRFAVRDIG